MEVLMSNVVVEGIREAKCLFDLVSLGLTIVQDWGYIDRPHHKQVYLVSLDGRYYIKISLNEPPYAASDGSCGLFFYIHEPTGQWRFARTIHSFETPSSPLAISRENIARLDVTLNPDQVSEIICILSHCRAITPDDFIRVMPQI